MKKIFSISFLFALCMFAMQANAQDVGAQAPASVAAPKAPVQAAPPLDLKWEATSHDFGTIQYAGDGTYTFTFKNTGKTPVIIDKVQASCGCTTPSYSKEPVMPGKEGTITARYDTTRQGHFAKTLTVYFQGGQTALLTIQGDVAPKPVETGQGQ